jgi:hypothetical protein
MVNFKQFLDLAPVFWGIQWTDRVGRKGWVKTKDLDILAFDNLEAANRRLSDIRVNQESWDDTTFEVKEL